jgi:hypothetical protein
VASNPVTSEPQLVSRNRKILVGSLLLTGALAGQCAGGKVIDNPSLITILVLVMGITAAALEFAGRARRTVTGLTIASLLLTGLTTMVGPGHWKLGGVWVFDIAAILLLFSALCAALSSSGTPRQARESDEEWSRRMRG